MGPLAIGAIAIAIAALMYGGYRLNKRRNLRLLREARRKKYAPDLPPLINPTASRTVIPSDDTNVDDHPPVERTVQIEELTEKEYDKWQERDEHRDSNIMELRLILEDIISELPELEEQNEGLNKSILTSLVFLIAGCATVIILLNGLIIFSILT